MDVRFCEGRKPPPRGTRASCGFASIVRAPPKRASGESFSPLTKDLHGCPVLRRQETTAERHTCELRVLIDSIVRAPPKRASGESFPPLTKDLHGGRQPFL